MKPLKLKMGAFGSYANETSLDFSALGGNGLYLITGETGAGKTTIFDAISYALFGKASGNARNNYKMLRSDYAEGRTKTFVALDFLSGGEVYAIRREIIPHFARKTDAVSYTDSVALTLPDGTVLERSREVDEKISEVVGLDRDQFAQIVMIAQNDFLRFLQSGTEERVKILRRIFNTGQLKRFQEGLKLRAKEKETEYKAVIRVFEQHNVDHNNPRQQFAQWEQEIAQDSEAIRHMDEQLQKTDKAKETFATKIAVAEGLCKQFEELARQQAALKEHREKAGEMDRLAGEKERGEIALHKVTPLAEKYAEAEASHIKAKESLETAKSEVEAAVFTLQQANQVITELPSIENAQVVVEALKQEWQATSNQLEVLEALDDNEKNLTEQQTALAEAKEELRKIEAFMQHLPVVDTAKEALDSLTRSLEQETDRLQVLTALQEEHQSILDKQQVLSAREEELDALLETISYLPSLDDARQRFEQITRDAERATERLCLLEALQTDQIAIAEKQEQLVLEQEILLRLKGRYDSAKNEYDEFHERFILEQAGILATTLRQGEPCPVCGSQEHPAPAPVTKGEINGDNLQERRAELDIAKHKLDSKSAQCSVLLTEIEFLTKQINTQLATHISHSSYENVVEGLFEEIQATMSHGEALTKQKAVTKASLDALATQIELTAQRQAELLPLCVALRSEIATMKGKLLRDVTMILPNASWDMLEMKLPDLLHDAQRAVEKMRVKKAVDDTAFEKLKKDREQSDRKQQEWNAGCLKLAATVSTLTDRFLQDLSKHIPDVTLDSASSELSVLLFRIQERTAQLTAKKDAAEIELIALKSRWETATQHQTNCNTAFEKANARIDEREKHARHCHNQREEARALFASALEINGFSNETAYTSAVVPEATLANMDRELAGYSERGRRITQDIDRLEKDTAGKDYPDLEGLQKEFQALKNTTETLYALRDEAKLRLDNRQRMLKELQTSSEVLAIIEREYAAVKTLSDTANAKLDFETYAQMAYFERVLRAANFRLRVMSQNRYRLLRGEESNDGRKRMGLDIEVADSYTGKSRSANSLSGGESFMASLSLALGLSDVVQQSAGGIHLDAMFIDEGFGSLDGEVLELSVRTLSEMANGNRIIGIISHVAELRERIEKQVHVEKSHRGSNIRLVL